MTARAGQESGPQRKGTVWDGSPGGGGSGQRVLTAQPKSLAIPSLFIHATLPGCSWSPGVAFKTTSGVSGSPCACKLSAGCPVPGAVRACQPSTSTASPWAGGPTAPTGASVLTLLPVWLLSACPDAGEGVKGCLGRVLALCTWVALMPSESCGFWVVGMVQMRSFSRNPSSPSKHVPVGPRG